jgi:FAD/FMN-containing dehydrogenase
MLNRPSERLLADLAERLGPRGLSRNPQDIAPWVTDWRGRYHGAAAALASPASLEEVQAVVAACAEGRVALVPQGGNTSMVGGGTPDDSGNAILLSLRRMNRIRGVSADDNSLVAEAGTILAKVHEAAAAAGRRFPLTLGARGSATVGGLVSTNAGGTQVLRFGTMRALVLGLEAVLPDGSVLEGLSALRKDNRGYDLKQLLIGAEGTLGVVTAASLRLVPAVGSRAVAWIGVERPAAALALLRFLEERIGDRVESFELVPRIALDLVLAHVPGTRSPLPTGAPWNVLVEATAATGSEAADLLRPALEQALETGLILDAALAASEAQAEEMWQLRDSISEAERHAGPGLKHDISVPVAAMPAFVEREGAAIEAGWPGTRVIAFGHLGDGNIHFNVVAPSGPDAARWMEETGPEVTRQVYEHVTAEGGSISAEHGIGQMKRDALAKTAHPAMLAAQRRIKAALDPLGIMNPGKIFL